MNRISVVSSTLKYSLVSVLAFIIGFGAPASAFADVSVTTQQLATGTVACDQAAVFNFAPYIYDGSLDSFDYTLEPNGAYIPVVTTVNGEALPPQFTTTHASKTDSGKIVYHTDMASTRVSGGVIIKITAFERINAQVPPVCMATITLSIPPSTSGTKQTSIKAVSAPVVTTVTEKTAITKGNAPTTTELGWLNQPARDVSTTASSAAPLFSGLGCTVQPSGLWWALLLVFIALIAMTVFAPHPKLKNPPERRAWAIVVSLVVLLALWYILGACAQSNWFPIASIIAAIVGFIGLHPSIQNMKFMGGEGVNVGVPKLRETRATVATAAKKTDLTATPNVIHLGGSGTSTETKIKWPTK